MSIAQSVRKAFAQREAGPPPPTIIPLADVERLGRLRNREFVKYRGTEYAVDWRHAIRDDSPTVRLADSAVYISGPDPDTGDLVYWRAKADSFAALPAAKARRTRPSRRVDAISAIPLFAARSERMTSVEVRPERDLVVLSSDSVLTLQDPAATEGPAMAALFDDRGASIARFTPAEPAASGVDAILARLSKAGARVELTPDRAHLAVVTEGGAMSTELREAIATVAPLLVAHLAGASLTCAWCPAVAVTLLLGGSPACAAHAGEEVMR
ncbi:MAG TPA: hypothetical protein VIK08_00620 [Candidatus Limnocylindrales bacterium]